MLHLPTALGEMFNKANELSQKELDPVKRILDRRVVRNRSLRAGLFWPALTLRFLSGSFDATIVNELK